MKFNKRFKKTTRYPHQRSEGLTRRGIVRQTRLMTGFAGPARVALALMDRGVPLRAGVKLALLMTEAENSTKGSDH